MNHNYLHVIACVLLSFSGYSASITQSSGPEFLDCSSTPDSLCVQEEGVRLPSNNQLFLGEEDPDATSCSVHISRTKQVTADCGNQLHYRVELFLNDTGPAIILQPLTTVNIDSSGQATLFFDTELSPDSMIQLSGIPYQDECNVYHRIVWIVVDSCGQENTCSMLIIVFDCSLPAASVPTFTYVVALPIGCWLDLYASDFHTDGLDDCTTRENLDFSFDSTLYQPHLEMHPCSIPAYYIALPWKIWIADEGVDKNCDGQIDWNEQNKFEHNFSIIFTDNGGGCCEPVYDIYLSGNIITEFGQGIKDVAVTLSSPGQVYPTYVTGNNGNYYFQYSINGEATISAERNDFHKNGVSTLDLVKIQKHLLGKDTLESPYLIIAADANNSQHVSAIDLVELRKLILGVYTELPSNQSWRFVPAAYVFPDPLDPWTDTIAPLPHNGSGTITITDAENPGNLDFIGIKIGDVNGSAKPDLTQLLPRESIVPFELKTDQQFYLAGDIINVPIRISADQKLTGFQFTLAAPGMEFVNIFPGQLDVSEEHFAIYNDKMSISWFDENTIDVAAEDVLFTLQLRATTSGNIGKTLSINSEIAEAEIYLANEETLLPFLKVQDQHAEDLFKIISCAPNPWKEETMIHFYLPESDQLNFTLTDVSGRQIFSTTSYLNKGYHQQLLKSSDFQGRGILFLRISSSTMSEIAKMIVAE